MIVRTWLLRVKDRFAKIIRAQQEELAALARRDARRARWRARWASFIEFWRGVSRNMKLAAKIAGAAVAIATAVSQLLHLGRMMRARDVGAPELPATGNPTTAPDFVPRPPKP